MAVRTVSKPAPWRACQACASFSVAVIQRAFSCASKRSTLGFATQGRIAAVASRVGASAARVSSRSPSGISAMGSLLGCHLGKSRDDFRRRLDQFDQHAFAADREFLIALGVQEGDVKARRTLADAARSEANAIGRQPFDSLGQVVDPQADVIERRSMNRRLLFRIERLHQVDLDLERATTHGADILVDILALGNEGAADFQAENVDQQGAQLGLGGAADGDLLNAENLERTYHDWIPVVG